MTDLKDKTVEFLESAKQYDLNVMTYDELLRYQVMSLCAFDELARRLEEAQKQIVELSEQLSRWQKGYNTLSRSWYEAEIDRLKGHNAAHDAETAAKALEELAKEYVEVGLLSFAWGLQEKAAEYRNGRKE